MTSSRPVPEENRLCPVRIRRTTVSAPTDRRSPTPIPPATSPGEAGAAGGGLSGSAATAGAVPETPRRRLVLAAVLAVALVAALVVAIVHGGHNGPTTAGAFSDARAKTAIQGYLDALEHRDIETIARNSLCGIYDAVRDRRSDQALAKLTSDAFRKQFTEAQVTSIDKIVYWSNYQAQVLFSMRVAPATGGAAREQVQGIAQLLYQHNQSAGVLLRAANGGQLLTLGSVEGVTTGARAGGVRVVDGKALLLDGVDEVDGGALHVGGAHPVDGQRHAAEIRGQVAVERAVVEEQVVTQTRASTGLDRDTQRQVVASLLLQQ